MKLIKFIALVLCATQFHLVHSQYAVTIDEAASVASNELDNTRNIGIKKINSRCDENQNTLLYEIIFSDSTVVLTSAHKSCMAVLGVFKTKGVSVLEDAANIPCGLKCFITSAAEYVKNLWQNGTRNTPDSSWLALSNTDRLTESRATSVSPLLSSVWGQNISNDGNDRTAYNDFTPNCGNGDNCPAGCVAVAMGQIMYYWKYPFFLANAKVPFDWCNMTDGLYTTSAYYNENKLAINNLLRDCGDAVNIEYHCDGSGTNALNANDAFKYRYCYKSQIDTMKNFIPTNQNGAEGMYNRIVENLKKGWPVLMRAADPQVGGHAFVIDGVDKKNRLHINWGWCGDGDGYYYFLELNPSYSFTHNYGVVYNITPQLDASVVDETLFLSCIYEQFLNSLNPILPWKFVPTSSVTLISAGASFTESWRTIPAGETAIYQAQEEIVLQDGFEAKRGCEFTAQIVPCSRYSRGVSDEFRENSDDTAAEYRYASVAPDAQLPQAELYPNPTDGPLFMPTDGMATAVLVYDLMGRPVGGWHLSALTETGVDLDVSALRPGAYLLAVQTETGTRTARFVRK